VRVWDGRSMLLAAASLAACGGSTLVGADAGSSVDAAAPEAAAASDGEAFTADAAEEQRLATDAAEAALPSARVDFETSPGYGFFFAQFASALRSPECAVLAEQPACEVYRCPPPDDGGATRSAGTLTIAGGFLDGSVQVEPGADGMYMWNTPYAGDDLFAPGQAMTVRASGAQVPAFGPESIVGPAPLALTAPMLPSDGGRYALSTSQDLIVGWTGGSPGDRVMVQASGFDSSFAQVMAECYFDASAQQGTVPHAAMAYLQGLSQGVLIWGAVHGRIFAAGDASVRLSATNYDYAWVTLQ